MPTTKKQFDLITVGGATVDLSFYSQEGELVSTGNITKQKLLAFEYGAKVVADKIYTTCGGGAANVAVSASRLGLKSSALVRIGNDDNGKVIFKNFKENKVDTSLIKIDKNENSAFSMVLTIDNASKEHIAFIYRGANTNLSAKDIDVSKLNTDWLYVTSLSKTNWTGIMEKLVSAKKRIVWNPGNEQLNEMTKLKKFLPAVDILIINRDEALEFRKLKDTKGLMKYIFSLGLKKLVVVTDGASGAYAYDGKKYYFIKSKKAKPLNTLGVGDAFGSSLTSALIYDKSIKEALEWGITNSASVLTKIGAQTGLLVKSKI
jgi:ribokinase